MSRRLTVRAGKIAKPPRAHLPTIGTLDAIEAAVEVTSQADQRLRNAVAAARADGHTWRSIGSTLGVTSQAAHRRFSGPSL